MKVPADKVRENESRSTAVKAGNENNTASTFQFADNRPEAIRARNSQELADNSPGTQQLKAIREMTDNNSHVKQMKAIQGMMHNSPRTQRLLQLQSNMQAQTLQKNAHLPGVEEEVKEEPIQGKFEAVQRMAKPEEEEEKPVQGKFESNREKPNNTGLPDNLKAGIESLSNHSMDDVKVHYNSDKPAQLNAHAYAQGTDIHLASGQEKHLPHEAWHVVQQKQGRVKATKQLREKVNINDDRQLEKEADVMGNKALTQMIKVRQTVPAVSNKQIAQRTSGEPVMQRMVSINSNNLHAEVVKLIKDPTIISNLTEAYTLLQHLDWAHNIVGGKVFDLGSPSFNSIGSENLIMVAHGAPGSSGGFSGQELGDKLADGSTGLPDEWDGEIFVTSCYSGVKPDVVIEGIAQSLKKHGKTGIKVTGYGGTTFTHKQFNEFLFVLKPGMEKRMKKINDKLATKYVGEFTTWWKKMQSLTADNILEMAAYTSELTAKPYRELIEMAVEAKIEFLDESEGEVTATS